MKPNLTRMGVGLVAVALVGGVVTAPDRRQTPDRPYVSITWAGQQWVIPAGARVAPQDPVFQRRAAAADEVELAFAYRDRDGAAATNATTILIGVDDPSVLRFIVPGPDGRAATRLPKGRYSVVSSVDTARPGNEIPTTSVLANPELTVGRDTAVEVDARRARPVSVSVPDPKAVGVNVSATFARLLAAGPFVLTFGTPDTSALFTAHEGPEVPGDTVEAAVSAFFARPGPRGTTVDSPLVYATTWHRTGRFFTGFRKRVTEADLATVRAEHGSTAPGRGATKVMIARRPFYGMGYSFDASATPFTRTERYAGDVQWANELTEFTGVDRDVTVQRQAATTYRPGRRVDERWNVAPFWPDPQTDRAGDTIVTRPALFGDQAGRSGTSHYRWARLALHRNGELVGESDRLEGERFTVPADRATYRLTAEAERDFTDLGAKVSATWTFQSAHGEQPRLLSVRYTPPVDLRGNATGIAIPVHVEGTARPHSLAVSASHDGGATWQPLTMHGSVALLKRPPRPGPVSLRAVATDAAGNGVEQTVVDAFRIP
jgi:hypothetical protein